MEDFITIRNEGCDAFFDGLTINDCPYEVGSEEFETWVYYFNITKEENNDL